MKGVQGTPSILLFVLARTIVACKLSVRVYTKQGKNKAFQWIISMLLQRESTASTNGYVHSAAAST